MPAAYPRAALEPQAGRQTDGENKRPEPGLAPRSAAGYIALGEISIVARGPDNIAAPNLVWRNTDT